MKIEKKEVELVEFKFDDETRTIEGYGSVFNNVDNVGDIVLPGAFAKSISARKPAMLYQHRSSDVIGVWDTIEENKRGLFVRGRIVDTTLGNDAYKLAKAGAISGLSIGYATKQYEIDAKENTRKLKEIELFEISLVTFPVNEKAIVTGVKALADMSFDNIGEYKAQIEAALRDAGASISEAKYIASLVKSPASRDAEGKDLANSLSNAINILKGK